MASNRFGRNRAEQESTPVEVQAEDTAVTADEAVAEATPTTETNTTDPNSPERKVERKPVDTGKVTTIDAEGLGLSDLKVRKTRLETHPLFIAVRDAAQDAVKLTQLEDESKADAVKTVLRRAASKLGNGMNFGDVKVREDGVYLPWAKTAKRVTKKNATAETPAVAENA